MGISSLTGKMYKNRESTAISDRALISEHHPNLESFSILSEQRSRSAFKLLIKPALDDPTLIVQLFDSCEMIQLGCTIV